jgi:hypothetical protein
MEAGGGVEKAAGAELQPSSAAIIINPARIWGNLRMNVPPRKMTKFFT